MAWQEAWGTYANSGAPLDVGFVGGPSTSVLGFDLTKAKQAGYGWGINFNPLVNDGTKVRVDINLIGIPLKNGRWSGNTGAGYASPNGGITASGWTYKWFVDFYYSTDNGRTYKPIQTDIEVASHDTPMALAYNEQTGISHWTNAHIKTAYNLTVPSNMTHIKVEVRGEDPAQRHQNIYGREIIIPPIITLKPWAIRKSGQFKTLHRQTGRFQVRKSGRWGERSSVVATDVGKPNVGTSRLRRNRQFVCQNKIGVL